MCLLSEGIDDNDSGVGILRQAKGLSNNDRCVGRGRRIRNASEILKTKTEAAGARRRPQGFYVQQRQRMRRKRIVEASKGLKTMTAAEEDWRRAWWIGNNKGILILLAFRLLAVTLSRLCRVPVLFWYCFHQILFFLFDAQNTISTVIMRKIFVYQIYTNLAHVPPTYRRVKKLEVLIINKDVHKSLAHKNGNDNPIWSWNISLWVQNVFI